jgi:non-heme chloroperoxidase
LNALLDHLGLDEVVLAGFSMGTGEVTRYLGRYGSARVRKASLFGVVPPFLLKTPDNPEGVDGEVFEQIKAAIAKDRYAYFADFFDGFYNTDKLMPERISQQAVQASFNVAAAASPYASYACVDSWLTDFRDDLPKIDIPTLVVHGTAVRNSVAATVKLTRKAANPGVHSLSGVVAHCRGLIKNCLSSAPPGAPRPDRCHRLHR